MNTLPRLTLFLLIGIVSCSTPERNAGKVINAENSLPNKHDDDTALVCKTIADIKSNTPINDTLSSVPLHSTKKRIKIVENQALIAADFNADEESYIIPGFSRNTFTKNGKNIDFVRTVKSDEDKRVGCSGGQKDLSFTVVNAADTFLLENEMLKSLNFKYHIIGGIYDEYGENPYKGKITGVFLSDNSWQIEINVWLLMKDVQNKEFERQIVLNEKFTL